MMQPLADHDRGKFIEGFCSLEYCLLRKIEIVYGPESSRTVSAWIDARDYEKKAEEVWVACA